MDAAEWRWQWQWGSGLVDSSSSIRQSCIVLLLLSIFVLDIIYCIESTMKILLLLTILIFTTRKAEADLEVFSDDDLLNLLNTEKFVVVLFSKYFRLVRLRYK